MTVICVLLAGCATPLAELEYQAMQCVGDTPECEALHKQVESRYAAIERRRLQSDCGGSVNCVSLKGRDAEEFLRQIQQW